jgi:starch phosphorylase
VAKAQAKSSFANWLRATSGRIVDPQTVFDCQVKRIHEYKRQLLNALRIVIEYNRLRNNPNLEIVPRTYFFAGKAAPAYRLAKLIIKFINKPGRGLSIPIRLLAAASALSFFRNTTFRWRRS